MSGATLDLFTPAPPPAPSLRRRLPKRLLGEGIADEHKQHIRRVIQIIAERGRPFSIHDVSKALCEATTKALATRTGTLGAAMVNAWRHGVIDKTGGRCESPWETKHARKVDEWIIAGRGIAYPKPPSPGSAR